MDAALRKRYTVLSDGYHGHDDWSVSLTPPADGVPPNEYVEKLKHPLDEQQIGTAAAVIIEPVDLDWSAERVEYLKQLREICTKHSTVLIYDETISGLRFPGLSVARWTGVYPDLIVLGKALGNGLPISIVGGRTELMDGEFFISSTFAGDTLPMAAATMTMPLAASHIDAMWDLGGRFQKEFNAAGQGDVWLEGYPTRAVLKAKDDLTKALFMQETCKAGVLFGASWFWSEPHAAEFHFALDVCQKVFAKIRNGEAKLEGEMPKKPFAQVQREQNA